MKHGGKRSNAGRKKGVEIPKIREYFTAREIEDFVADLRARAGKSDKIATWLGDQIFHKAPQTIEGNIGGTLTITFDPAFTTEDA
jgi:hypothetical protein